MAYTPASSARGRIPTTPGRGGGSGIPTPGRSRAGSTVNSIATVSASDDSPAMSRALSDAIRSNDPKQHRMTVTAPGSSTSRPSDHGSSLSPHSSPSSQSGALPVPASGRRSVARPSNITTNNIVPGRSSSVTSSTTSAPQPPRASLPKTPSSSTRTGGFSYTPRASTSRPESRQSDVYSRRESRSTSTAKDRTFEPGDSVRIESLGMEGTLRFLGPIEGKPGTWAGVELAPGFAGRGKNDGTVNGVSYFSCSPKCGVFVALAKLSAPIFRPSSVASSRGRATPSLPPLSASGRRTPSVSGRVTPGFSTGRATPAFSTGRSTPARSTGRVTPSYSTPAARPRPSVVNAGVTPGAKPRTTSSASSAQTAESKITAGSRASRYIGMTAQQLQTAKSAESSPAVSGNASPTRTSGPPPSPFATPKPPGGVGRTSGIGIPAPGGMKARQSAGGFGFGAGTPRSGRKTDMPPPASPISPSKRLQAGSPSRRLTTPTSPSRRLTTPTGSEFSVGLDEREERSEQMFGLEARNRELQDRIANLMSGKAVNGGISPTAPLVLMSPSTDDLQADKAALEVEKARAKEALTRVSELETQVRFHERAVKERESRIEGLERSLKGKEEDVDKVRADGDARARELTGKLEDAESLVGSLKAAVEEVRAGKKEEAEAIIGAKDKEIELLQGKVVRAVTELEEERKELGWQIEELRQAGQETIALYEEKLNEADGKRWEMEDLVHGLEDKLRKQNRSISPATMSRHASEAAQINNEMLKEQVLHFERKVGSLESQLENAREAADKEEQAMRTRIAKYKENDGALRKELADARAEVESRKRLEVAAKTRLEEVEEALRENAVALENARAEIEGLRADLANLEGLQAGVASADGAKAEDEATKRTAADRARSNDEVNHLKELLESSRTARHEAVEQCKTAKEETDAANQRADSLQVIVQALENDKNELERASQDRSLKLTVERKTVASLRQELDFRSSELEQLRKNANRDRSLSPAAQRESTVSTTSRTSRHEHRNSGEEITGLKHIIQELNKENLDITSRIKLVESDKKMLQEECDELREAMRMLESNVNDELKQLEGEGADGDSSADVQKTLREAKAKYELELGQLRQKSLEAEQKHAQTIRDLNKEVSELESLVEAKIYREDDLERELERYKEKLARASQRKLSKASGESTLSHAPPSSSSESGTRPDSTPEGEVCEICEQPGHDIFSCPLLKDDIPSAGAISQSQQTFAESSDLWCEDCESHGHVAADCPHSMDVF